MINLTSFVRGHAVRSPEKIAITYRGGNVTYAALHARVEKLAAYLAERGIGRGDIVALLMKNSPAFIEVALAVSHLGAVIVPINFRLSAAETAFVLGNAGAQLLFVDEELVHLAPGDLDSIEVSPAAQADTMVISGFAQGIPAMAYCLPSELFRVMYTSGTTSRPKGVMHSYENFYWKSVDHIIALGLTAETRLLVVGPLYHVGAFDLPGLAVLWMGGTLSIQRDFDPETVLRAIEQERLNAAWLAPVMTNALFECDRTLYDLSSLRWVVGGGERTPESRVRHFREFFPSARYIDAYGLTESCSGDTLMEPGFELTKIGSTGRALMHVEISIRGENGELLDVGVDGEICLRGPKVTKGYWKDPAATSAAFFGDWFRTGDVGHLDEDGFLFLTDRKKDMIISGGENIASSEVERVLYEMPEIADAAVIGVEDARWGERPVAIVVLKPGAQLDAKTVTDFCRQHLAAFKAPKDVVFREILPRNPSGKILKNDLRSALKTFSGS